jgi:uncharacterized integral membrane protein
MKKFFLRPKIIFWLVGSLIFLIFIFQNVEPTRVKILFWSLPEMPKLLLILLSMGLGALLTLIISWEIRTHRKNEEEEVTPPGDHHLNL